MSGRVSGTGFQRVWLKKWALGIQGPQSICPPPHPTPWIDGLDSWLQGIKQRLFYIVLSQIMTLYKTPHLSGPQLLHLQSQHLLVVPWFPPGLKV